MKLNSLASYLVLNIISEKEIRQIAMDLMESGVDYENITLLAGSAKLDYETAKKLLVSYLGEIKITLPSPPTAKINIMKDIFEKMKKKEITPQDGAKYIMHKLQDREQDNEFLGEKLGIEDLISVQYQIEDIMDGSIDLPDEEKKQAITTLEKEITKIAEDFLNRNKS